MAHAFLDNPSQDVWTADISLVEIAASMHRDGFALASIRAAVEAVATRSSKILYPDTADAVSAAFGRAALGLRKKDASLSDGLILAMARNRGADVVTCGEAFRGEPDVFCPKADDAPAPVDRQTVGRLQSRLPCLSLRGPLL